MKGAKGGLGGVVLPAGHDEIPDLLERGTEFHHLGRRIFDGIQERRRERQRRKQGEVRIWFCSTRVWNLSADKRNNPGIKHGVMHKLSDRVGFAFVVLVYDVMRH